MKTETTKKLEQLLARKFNPQNDFYVFECTLGWFGKEIVDCVMYNCQREVHCYEIKQSVSDFHSKNKLSFFGNKNYFVMPYELYEKVKDEIDKKYPKVGVYVSIGSRELVEEYSQKGMLKVIKSHMKLVSGFNELHCIKRATKQDLKADKEVILSSMLRSMQRELLK